MMMLFIFLWQMLFDSTVLVRLPNTCNFLIICIVLVLASLLSILKHCYCYKRGSVEKASGEKNTLPLFYMAYQLVLKYS